MKNQHLHFMGIGGQGISAVAQMALMSGEQVTGCDRVASATTQALEQLGIPIHIGHSEDHLCNADVLVISPAIPALNPHNVELVAAQHQGLRVVTWQELLGGLLQGKCLFSVSGVHGKGTTTAMLSLILVDAGLDPTCEIGAVVPRFGANYRLGRSQYVVNEADEFNHNFWHYHPRLVIVTSIEFEHPEFFADYQAFLAAFEHFIHGMDIDGEWPYPPTVILNADSPGCLDLHARLNNWPGNIVIYTVEGEQESVTAPSHSVDAQFIAPQATASSVAAQFIAPRPRMAIEAYDVRLDGETSFRVRIRELSNEHTQLIDDVIHLQIPGLYNIQNALAAFAAAHLIDIDPQTIIRSLSDFGGTRRRFEIRHQGPLCVNGRDIDVMLVDDYAHHPTAIASALHGARRRYPHRRLVAVYQPHMYSRTKTFFTQFLEAFDAADVVIIADIFPAREVDHGLIHARDLVAAMAQRPRFAQGEALLMHGGSNEHTAQLLNQTLQTGDLALIMGAGDIYTVTGMILKNT